MSLENLKDEAIPAYFAVTISGKKIKFVSGKALHAGKAANADFNNSSEGVETLAEALVIALVEQGLFEKEARAMVATWRDAWLEVKYSAYNTRYHQENLVGKDCKQITEKDSEIVADDKALYEKWAQAISSANDLVQSASLSDSLDKSLRKVVVPVLVVPDGTLWIVSYDENGNRLDKPKNTKACSLFIGRSYAVSSLNSNYTISHLEIVTEEGLKDFTRETSVRPGYFSGGI